MAIERKRTPKPTQMNSTERVIDSYFADLLCESPDAPPATSARVVDLRPAPPVTEGLPNANEAEAEGRWCESVSREVAGHPPAPPLESLQAAPASPIAAPDESLPVAPGAAKAVATPAETSAPVEPDTVPLTVPMWASEPFQCLMFKVSGVRLAMPLMTIDSIAEWDGRLNKIPGQPPWCLGVMRHRGQKVVVLDTGRLLMPERPAQAKRPGRGYVLLVGGGRWGLACDALQRPEMLEADAVKWRQAGAPRPWIAGTVIEKLCLLLEVDALLSHLGHE